MPFKSRQTEPPLLTAHGLDMEIWRAVFNRKFEMWKTVVARSWKGGEWEIGFMVGTVSIGKDDTPLEMDCARWSTQSFRTVPMSLPLQNGRLRKIV